MKRSATVLDEVDAAVDAILARLGPQIVLGLPLGLGKPVELSNALFRRAQRDTSVRLTILSALSLSKPRPPKGVEQAFLDPFIARVFENVPELDYVKAQHAGKLPLNVEVCEFFLQPGALLKNARAQQHYISSNYTHAARDVVARGVNVVAQMICKRETPEGPRYSLSCNPDTGPEVIRRLEEIGRPHLVVGVVNQNLPYFGHDAEVPAEMFDFIVDAPQFTTPLFPMPKMPVTNADYAIGLYASALVRDAGTLQLGIGSLGDSVAYALKLRHTENAAYRQLAKDFGISEVWGELVHEIGGLDTFRDGLYGATEMFVDGFWQLLRAGILKRRVYDYWALQQLVDDRRCDPARLTPDLLDGLAELGVQLLRARDFAMLQHHGVFSDETRYENGVLIAADGARIAANLAHSAARAAIAARCLGTKLRNGIVLHGGFLLGPSSFYQALRELDEGVRASICMTGVEKINQLDLNPRLYQLQRRHARFINTGMMVTLSGNFVSDGLDDGRVVSGVGGQYNFVAQAHQLKTGRSILLLRSTRDNADGSASSNVLFNYGHTTIPRHLRDIVVTEYGIADLRSKSDAEIAKALICIADSRFQNELIAVAKKAGRLEADWRLPERCRHNFPATIEERLKPHRVQRRFAMLPFGSDFNALEELLLPILARVRQRAATTSKWRLFWRAMRFNPLSVPSDAQPCLERLGLMSPVDMRSRIARMLVVEAMHDRARDAQQPNR